MSAYMLREASQPALWTSSA